MNINVAVHEKNGQIAGGLTATDFRIFIDGKEQTIASFSHGKPEPLHIALLLQWSGQRRDTLPFQELEPASHFLKSMINENDSASIARFSDKVVFLGESLNGPAEIEEALQRVRGTTPWGPPSLYDSIAITVKEKLASRKGHKAIVVFGDGRDSGSKNGQNDAIQEAVRGGARIYYISLAPANPYMKVSRSRVANKTAKALAQETGGNVFFVRDEDEITRALNQISQTLKNRYALACNPSTVGGDGKFHKLKVEVSRKNLVVSVPKSIFFP